MGRSWKRCHATGASRGRAGTSHHLLVLVRYLRPLLIKPHRVLQVLQFLISLTHSASPWWTSRVKSHGSVNEEQWPRQASCRTSTRTCPPDRRTRLRSGKSPRRAYKLQQGHCPASHTVAAAGTRRLCHPKAWRKTSPKGRLEPPSPPHMRPTGRNRNHLLLCLLQPRRMQLVRPGKRPCGEQHPHHDVVAAREGEERALGRLYERPANHLPGGRPELWLCCETSSRGSNRWHAPALN
jgi:hypothetical protein